MNRRSFLQALLAGVATVAVPPLLPTPEPFPVFTVESVQIPVQTDAFSLFAARTIAEIQAAEDARMIALLESYA